MARLGLAIVLLQPEVLAHFLPKRERKDGRPDRRLAEERGNTRRAGPGWTRKCGSQVRQSLTRGSLAHCSFEDFARMEPSVAKSMIEPLTEPFTTPKNRQREDLPALPLGSRLPSGKR